MLVAVFDLCLYGNHIADMEYLSCHAANCESNLALVSKGLLGNFNLIVDSFVFCGNGNITSRHCEIELAGLCVELDVNGLVHAVGNLNPGYSVAISRGNSAGNILACAKISFSYLKVVNTINVFSSDTEISCVILNANSLASFCGNDVLA